MDFGNIMTDFINTQDRIKISNFWIEKIREVKGDRTHMEYFTEPFLTSCTSITDYILYDYLESKQFTINDIRKISLQRRRINEISKLLNLSNDVTEFIKNYLKIIEEFRSQSNISYFLTLRNLITHGVIPHFYVQKENGLRFTDESLSFLLNNDGGYLLLNDGSKLMLNQGESLFSIYPLINIKDEEKTELRKILNETEPIKLMSEYLTKSESLMNKFSNLSN